MDSLVFDDTYLLYVDILLKEYGFETINFQEWISKSKKNEDLENEDIEAYFEKLNEEDLLPNLLKKISEEVFFLLFNNRSLLLKFNMMLSDLVKDLFIIGEGINKSDYLKKNGVLKRVNIPQWVAKAVFFRERGQCALCEQDISGIFSTQPERHLDHIVPLNLGGINDVSNIQLLCTLCNLSKSGKSIKTSNKYETWYK